MRIHGYVLVVALAIAGCASDGDSRFTECDPDGPEDQCFNGTCIGGICAGGTCGGLQTCPAGHQCVERGGALRSDVCEIPCETDEHCPEEWGCGEPWCEYPPPTPG